MKNLKNKLSFDFKAAKGRKATSSMDRNIAQEFLQSIDLIRSSPSAIKMKSNCGNSGTQKAFNRPHFVGFIPKKHPIGWHSSRGKIRMLRSGFCFWRIIRSCCLMSLPREVLCSSQGLNGYPCCRRNKAQYVRNHKYIHVEPVFFSFVFDDSGNLETLAIDYRWLLRI